MRRQGLPRSEKRHRRAVVYSTALAACLLASVFLLAGTATAATMILDPYAEGATTRLSVVGAAGNWQAVTSSDGDASYVYSGVSASTYYDDAYHLPNVTTSAGPISRVDVYYEARAVGTPSQASARGLMRFGAITVYGPAQILTNDYEVYRAGSNTHPYYGGSWTWGQVNELQVGVSLRRPNSGTSESRATRVYAVVTYTASYTLLASVNGGNGTISPASVTVTEGSNQTFTITPDPGYRLASLTDNGVAVSPLPTGGSYTVADVSANHVIVAGFAPDTYTVTYTAGPGGTIAGEAEQTVRYGEDGTEVEAVPDPGFRFTGWSDGVLTAKRTDTGVMADLSVTAGFAAADIFTLTYTAGLGGTIAGEAAQTVRYGENGTEVEAVPDPGFHFTGWSDEVTTAKRTDTGVMADLSVTAGFALNTYTLTYAAGPGGTVAGDNPQTVTHGEDGAEVEAVPDRGYHFTGWSDGVMTAKRTDTGVMADLAVTAGFARTTMATTMILDPYAEGATTRLGLVGAASNWQAVTSSDGDTSYVYSGTSASSYYEDAYHLPNVTTAPGPISRVDVYYEARAVGTPSQASARGLMRFGAITVFGPAQTLSTDYEVYRAGSNTHPYYGGAWTWGQVNDLQVGVSLRRPNSGTSESRTTRVYAAITYTAPAYTLLASVSGGNGTISPSSATVAHGSDQTFTITPDPGYRLADLTDNGVAVSLLPTDGSYTISKVSAHHDIVASFAPDTTPPVITPPGDITAEATGPEGAVVTFEPTAEHPVDGAVAVSADPPSGSTFPLGETTVNLSATSVAGNTATAHFKVTVVDTTPPGVTVEATPDTQTYPGDVVVTASVTDLASTITAVEYSLDGSTWLPMLPADGSFDGIAETARVTLSRPWAGEQTVYVRATDAAANTSDGAAAGLFTVVPFQPSVTFDGEYVDEDGGTTNLRATVDGPGSSGASVTFLWTSLVTGATGTETVTTDGSGKASATVLLTPGDVYDVDVILAPRDLGGSPLVECLGARAEGSTLVADPDAASTGGGWYKVAGASPPKVHFAYTVKAKFEKKTGLTTISGALLWTNQNNHMLKGLVTSFGKVASPDASFASCARAEGTGTLWDRNPAYDPEDPASEEWIDPRPVSFSFLAYDGGTSSGKKGGTKVNAPDAFGLQILEEELAAESAPVLLSGGNLSVK
jgi:hypothetical protein